MIFTRHIASALLMRYPTRKWTILSSRAVTKCKQLAYFDKNNRPKKRQTHIKGNGSIEFRSETGTKRVGRRNQMIKSTPSLSKILRPFVSRSVKIDKSLKNITSFGKPLLWTFTGKAHANTLKGYLMNSKQRWATGKQVDCENNHDIAYEETFGDAIEVFREQNGSVDRQIANKQTENANDQHHNDSSYEQTFHDALEAFNTQTEHAKIQFGNSKYEQAFIETLYAFNGQPKLELTYDTSEDGENSIVSAETKEIIKGLDLEKVIDSVVESADFSAQQEIAMDSEMSTLSDQQSEYRPYYRQIKFLKIYKKRKEGLKCRKLLRKLKGNGQKISYASFKKSFSSTEMIILQRIIKDAITEAEESKLGAKNHEKRGEQSTEELQQELVRDIMQKIMRNQIMKGKFLRLINFVKDRKNHQKLLKVLLWLIFKFFIFPELCGLFESIDIFPSKRDSKI